MLRRRERMKVTRFHHVSVNCKDATLDDMVTFYDDLFGLDSKARTPRSRASRAIGSMFPIRSCTSLVLHRRARRSTQRGTTTAWQWTIWTKPSPSLKTGRFRTSGPCRGRARCRFGSTIPPGTRSSCNRTVRRLPLPSNDPQGILTSDRHIAKIDTLFVSAFRGAPVRTPEARKR